MPRIDPHQLLKTLGVLLSPKGGIKSPDEVVRISTLMHKFSKKLVSKCIYVQILLSTPPELLDRFLDEGGWNLITLWFSDAVAKQRNWPFAIEMLRLLDHCPMTPRRLKEEPGGAVPAPKLVNQMRSDPEVRADVRGMAAGVYEKWLLVVSPEKAKKDSNSSSSGDEDELGSSSLNNSTSVDNNGVKPENGSISLLQSLADEVSESIKKEEGDKEDSKKEAKVSGKKVKKEEKSRRNSSSSKEKSRDKDDRRKRREDREKEKESRERKRFRPDRRDEVDATEKQRIREVARKMREQEQQKKDRDTLSKIGGPVSGLAKIPKIPKKKKEEGGVGVGAGKSFEDMLGGLDAKPKTVKTPMNKNKTASLLEGLTKTSPSSSSKKDSKHSTSKREHDRHGSGGSSSRSSSSSSSKKDSSSHHHHHHHSSHSSSHHHSGHHHHHHHHHHSKKESSPSSKPSKLSLSEKRSSTETAESPKGASKSSPHNFSESTGFMDAIFSSMNRDGPTRKKRRRLSESDPNSANPTAGKKEIKETKKEEQEEAKKEPTFSFYKETLHDNEEEEEDKKQAVTEEKMDTDEREDSGSRSATTSPQDGKSEEGLPEEPDDVPREVKGILVYHRGSEKRERKGITWKPETTLVSVRYFELDEDERVNVNKIKFENMRDMELKMEKAAFKSKGAVETEQERSAKLEWFKPPRVDVEAKEEPFEPGSKSLEKDVQREREKNILQALYFNKAMTPPSPAEPDPETNVNAEPPTLIPLDDVENGEESVEDYSSRTWLEPKVCAVDRKANLESTLSLPPALSNLLNSVSQLQSMLPPQPQQDMSQEERDMLAAQTEAMKAMGMLPGIDMPPSFPPPGPGGPPGGGQPPPGVPPPGVPPPHMGPPPGHPNGGPGDGFLPPPHFGPSNFGPGAAPIPPPGFSGPPPGMPPPNGGFPPPPHDFPPPPPHFRGGFGGGRGFPPGPPHRGFRGGGGGYPPRDRGGRGGRFHHPREGVYDNRIKTKPCSFFAQGYCRDGAECRFLHDEKPPTSSQAQ